MSGIPWLSSADKRDKASAMATSLPGLLVIRPSWLLSDVVGIMLSPEHFSPPHILYNKDGSAKRRIAEQVLETNFGKFVSGNEALQMVAQLGLCIVDEPESQTNAGSAADDDADIVVPSKIETDREILHRTVLCDSKTATWFGIRLLCSKVPLSVCLFPGSAPSPPAQVLSKTEASEALANHVERWHCCS